MRIRYVPATVLLRIWCRSLCRQSMINRIKDERDCALKHVQSCSAADGIIAPARSAVL